MDNLTGMILANVKRIYSLHANFRSLEELIILYYYSYLHFGDEKPDAQRSKNFVQWSTERLASVCIDWITWQ